MENELPHVYYQMSFMRVKVTDLNLIGLSSSAYILGDKYPVNNLINFT
jgi:hypothetical protein